MLKQRKYSSNVTFIKDFGGKRIKIVTMKTVRNSGVEDNEEKRAAKGSVNSEKLEENISRARSKIFEYAFCNPWEYFCTFTINKEKNNRYDLDAYHSRFSQFIRNYNKNNNCNIKYLFIPEQHQDGAWHEHGFLMGIPREDLHLFNAEVENLPYYIREKLLNKQEVYNWKAYEKSFGWNDLEPIRNAEACSKYITKYISKSLATSVKEINSHLYYCSKGLKKAVVIKKGLLLDEVAYTFENDYCRIAWLDYDEKAIENFMNNIL